MAISYDPAKNARNIELRGLLFDLVAEMDWPSAQIVEDKRKDYIERRYRVTGYIEDRLHVAVFTPRHGAIRVISFRKANAREVTEYGQAAKTRRS